MSYTLRVEPAEEADITRLVAILLQAFESMGMEQLLENTSTNADAIAARHLQAWRAHRLQNRDPIGYKCVHTDAQTGAETVVASASWVIYDHARPAAEYEQPHELLSGAWVADADRRRSAQQMLRPFWEARVRWMGARPYGLLMYMATDAAFQRRGAATACVRHGLERCRQLGIPALLEATDSGRPVYEALGFEMVEAISFTEQQKSVTFPVMIWWPPGTPAEDKKPALPDFKMSEV